MGTDLRQAKDLRGLGFAVATVLLFVVWLWSLLVNRVIARIALHGVPGFMRPQLWLCDLLLHNPIGVAFIVLIFLTFIVVSARVVKSADTEIPLRHFVLPWT